ncbi:MAG: hypothetical protein HC901_01075 [Bdellovibrionaceae bacterium]|nr:hypothetical protein [Pseudobdellovibrionaceae bacterium]
MRPYLSALLFVTAATAAASPLETAFVNPPDAARPGVYWYFMDGNQDREMMEVDLRSMHAAGLRKALFLEVNIGSDRAGEIHEQALAGQLCARGQGRR